MLRNKFYHERARAFCHAVELTLEILAENDQKSISNNIDKLNQPEDIFFLIQQIQIAQDAENNIYSYMRDDSKHGLPILFRDARMARDEMINSYHSFAVIGLHAWFAARKLAEIAGIENLNQCFDINDAEQFYESIRQNEPGDNHAFDLAVFIDQYVIPELAYALKITKEQAEKRLHVAKEFCNFEFPPFAIASLTKHQNSAGKNFTLLHADAPIYQLSERQKDLYLNRKNKDSVWYNKQPAWLRGLINHYVDKIIEGRVIPTQLRKYLPGLRNAGHEVVIAFNDDQEHMDIYQGYHSGNLGHLTKGNNAHFTELAACQLQEAANIQHLHLNALTTPIPIMGKEERRLHLQAKKAKKSLLNITYSNTPINIFRPVAGFRLKNMKIIFTKARDLLEQVLEHQYFSKSADSRTFWSGLLNACQSNPKMLFKPDYRDNECFVNLMEIALEYRSVKRANDESHDGNRNLELANKINLLASYYSDCCDYLKLSKMPHFLQAFAVNSFCKSGKDREGLLRILTVTDGISRFLKLQNEDERRQVLKTIIAAGHVQRQAGMTGATMGAEGFVPTLIHCLPDRFMEFAPLLLLPSAKYNKHYPAFNHHQPTKAQKDRLHILFARELDGLKNDVGQPGDDILKNAGVKLKKELYRAYLGGKIASADLPIHIQLIRLSRIMLANQPDSPIYLAALGKYARVSDQVLGRPSLAKVIGGVALIFLGVGIMAASLALGIPSGGISLGGILIAAEVIAFGASFTTALCVFGGGVLGLFGTIKQDVAVKGEKFLEVARFKAETAFN